MLDLMLTGEEIRAQEYFMEIFPYQGGGCDGDELKGLKECNENEVETNLMLFHPENDFLSLFV
jgi:hypothetical protein